MIKFLLGFVALIVVLLAAYMFTNKPAETAKKETTSNIVKKDVSKTEIEVSEVAEVKTSKKVISVKRPSKDMKKKLSKSGKSENSIGEGITLESIENMNISDEEKELLIADIVYHQTSTNKDAKVLTYEEGLELIANDVKNGIIE